MRTEALQIADQCILQCMSYNYYNRVPITVDKKLVDTGESNYAFCINIYIYIYDSM